MKRKLAFIFAIPGWFAIIAQYFLMVENRTASMLETTINFFSFFTILTNILVAIYFTLLLFPEHKRPGIVSRPGTLTAITIYILIVGLVYQVALRHLWQPEGLQLVVDELLHSIIPVLVFIFWCLYENKRSARYGQIAGWAIYPLAYLLYTLIRGKFSGVYPYPFINVANIGFEKALINAGVLLLLFLCIAALFIFAGRAVGKKQENKLQI